MSHYDFPPNPSPRHLELQKKETLKGQIPKPAPPIPHATPYMDVIGIRKAQNASQPGSLSPERNGVTLPWGNRTPRPQDGIASGLATTLGFGAAAAAAGNTFGSFKPADDDKTSSEK